MRLFERFSMLVKADAHGVMDSLEERSLLGKTGEIRLVTSDRQLAAYARSLGARIETSEECAKHLVGHRRPPGHVSSARRERAPARRHRCRRQLAEVIEEWVLVRVSRGLTVPAVDGVTVAVTGATDATVGTDLTPQPDQGASRTPLREII